MQRAYTRYWRKQQVVSWQPATSIVCWLLLLSKGWQQGSVGRCIIPSEVGNSNASNQAM
jgi:hypothetical protein